MRTARTPASSCSGFRTSVSGIVEQFGFATIPSCSSARLPFTSGTTSGTPGSSRNAADLSMQSAPPRTACGTSSRLALVPTEKRQTSRSPAASASGVASSTTRPRTSLPAERADAKTRTSSKPRSASRSTATRPTAPVAPITATLGMLPLRFGRVELERLVEDPDRGLDLVAADVAGDLDRRGGDDLGLDSRAGEALEGLGRHAGVALHPRADHADLAEVVAGIPPHAEVVEHLRS